MKSFSLRKDYLYIRTTGCSDPDMALYEYVLYLHKEIRCQNCRNSTDCESYAAQENMSNPCEQMSLKLLY